MLKEQLLSDEFKEVTGGKTFSKIVLFTDNALNDSCHLPFIMQCNSQNKNLQIVSWQNPEAQVSMIVYSLLIVIITKTNHTQFFSILIYYVKREKLALVSHFKYVQLHVRNAILSGDIPNIDAHSFYKCLKFDGGIKSNI